MTFEKKSDIARDFERSPHFSLWKSLPSLKKQFTLLPLAQINRNLEVKPLKNGLLTDMTFVLGK